MKNDVVRFYKVIWTDAPEDPCGIEEPELYEVAAGENLCLPAINAAAEIEEVEEDVCFHCTHWNGFRWGCELAGGQWGHVSHAECRSEWLKRKEDTNGVL